jgi:hypothetical protein
VVPQAMALGQTRMLKIIRTGSTDKQVANLMGGRQNSLATQLVADQVVM